jgi:hypothetical protein
VRQLAWHELPAHKPRILLAHGSVHGFAAADLDADDDNPTSANNRLQLDATLLDQLDYIALGDWHGLKQINTHTWYSGTPEPDRFPRSNDYQGGQVLVVRAQRGAAPAVESQSTAALEWLQLRAHLTSSDDLQRLERQLKPLLEGEPGRQLLLLEQSGSLGLEAHQRYEQLLERLDAQLLRLKRRGRIEQQADPEELELLLQRAEDPLIASVAGGIQADLAQATLSSDNEQRQLLQLALAELHRAAGAAGCA